MPPPKKKKRKSHLLPILCQRVLYSYERLPTKDCLREIAYAKLPTRKTKPVSRAEAVQTNSPRPISSFGPTWSTSTAAWLKKRAPSKGQAIRREAGSHHGRITTSSKCACLSINSHVFRDVLAAGHDRTGRFGAQSIQSSGPGPTRNIDGCRVLQLKRLHTLILFCVIGEGHRSRPVWPAAYLGTLIIGDDHGPCCCRMGILRGLQRACSDPIFFFLLLVSPLLSIRRCATGPLQSSQETPPPFFPKLKLR